MRQKLNLIMMGVVDMQATINFHEKGLGWKRSAGSMDDLLLFPLGGVILAFYPGKLLAEDANVTHEGDGFSGVTVSYNAYSEEDVDEVIKEVAVLGAAIVKPAQKVSWGGYSGYFKDPNDFLVEVAFNPFWKLDDMDNLVLPG